MSGRFTARIRNRMTTMLRVKRVVGHTPRYEDTQIAKQYDRGGSAAGD